MLSKPSFINILITVSWKDSMKSTELKSKKFITNFYTIDNFTFRMESIEH